MSERLTIHTKKSAIINPNLTISRQRTAIRKLAAYEDAEAEGRLVILPVRIGATLYRIWRIKSGKRKEAVFVSPVVLNCHNFWRIVFGGELGKTVFLTRGEAEAALGAGEESR